VILLVGKIRRAWLARAMSTCLCTVLILLAVPTMVRGQLSTEDHASEPGFWPTQKGAQRSDYAGTPACHTCHAGIWSAQRATPMANAAPRASESGILQSHPKLEFSVGQYHYEVKTDAKGSLYTLTGAGKTLSYPLVWAFGIGRVGQSYLFKKEDGEFYEARITFFETLKKLDFTPGRALPSPHSAEEAMYRQVGPAEVAKCFACHTTGSTFDGQIDEKNLTTGVSCEACHGPGAKHVSAMQTAKISGLPDAGSSLIFNSSKLPPVDSVDFCGACHGTFWDVKLSGVAGASTARSQPYRLELSKCWGTGDARLTCIACHDPHQQLETDDASYDRNCLTCHAHGPGAKKTADHPGAPCPAATKNCASCHMPKVLVPEMHANFTDHRIRIVRAAEAYPE
jgi:hypothetical protein